MRFGKMSFIERWNWIVVIFYLVMILFFFLMPSIGHCEDICLSENSAKQVVVDVEKGKVCEDQVAVLQEENAELEKQIQLLRDVNDLQKERIKIADETIVKYQGLLKVQEETYDALLKAQKPGFFESLGKALGFVGIGALAALVL